MKKILISAGGTGGHIFPALTIAKELKHLNADVAWVGTPYGLETSIIPLHQIPLFLVDMKGLHNKGWKRWMWAPFMLAKALVQAIGIIRKFQPDVVFGMGAYATAPIGIAARLCRKKLVIFEQNAKLGLANQLLAPLAQKIFTGFPMGGNSKFEYANNPVRKEISDIPPPEKRQRIGSSHFHLLIFGGSQGSRTLNEKIPQALEKLPAEKRPEIWHQIGCNTDKGSIEQLYKKLETKTRVDIFIDNMASAYRWADLVICRAGASTITELCAVGIPSILIPLPAVGDHQTYNARFLSGANAAVLLSENSLTAESLSPILLNLIDQPALRLSMAMAARKLRLENTVDQILKALL